MFSNCVEISFFPSFSVFFHFLMWGKIKEIIKGDDKKIYLNNGSLFSLLYFRMIPAIVPLKWQPFFISLAVHGGENQFRVKCDDILVFFSYMLPSWYWSRMILLLFKICNEVVYCNLSWFHCHKALLENASKYIPFPLHLFDIKNNHKNLLKSLNFKNIIIIMRKCYLFF